MRTCVHGASLLPRPLLRKALVADFGSSNNNPSRRPSPDPDRRVRSEIGRLETASVTLAARRAGGRGGRTTITVVCRWVVYCNCLVMLAQKAFQSAGYFPIIKSARSQEAPPPQRSAGI